MDYKEFEKELKELLEKHDVALEVISNENQKHPQNCFFAVTDNRENTYVLNNNGAYLDKHHFRFKQ